MEGLSSVDRVFNVETIAQEIKEWSEEVGKTDRVARMQLQGVSNWQLSTQFSVYHTRAKLGVPAASEEFENSLKYLLEAFKDAMKKDEFSDFTFKTKLYNETGECLGKRVWKAAADAARSPSPESDVPFAEMVPMNDSDAQSTMVSKEPVISSVA
jgi:hypothetical protein